LPPLELDDDEDDDDDDPLPLLLSRRLDGCPVRDGMPWDVLEEGDCCDEMVTEGPTEGNGIVWCASENELERLPLVLTVTGPPETLVEGAGTRGLRSWARTVRERPSVTRPSRRSDKNLS